MERRIKISASYLSADFSRLGEIVKEADKHIDIFHHDVMDGHFVPNITFGPVLIQSLRRYTKKPFHAHLMIENPEQYIGSFVDAGCDTLIVHAEACRNLESVIRKIQLAGAKPGVAVNPGTDIKKVAGILGELDIVLVMSVNPGFAGQEFISGVLEKVRALRAAADKAKLQTDIGIDGGINKKTAPLAVIAGANVLCAASAIFNGKGTIAQSAQELRAAARR